VVKPIWVIFTTEADTGFALVPKNRAVVKNIEAKAL
jgi:hypothetical protein